jgi:hypothetical protein
MARAWFCLEGLLETGFAAEVFPTVALATERGIVELGTACCFLGARFPRRDKQTTKEDGSSVQMFEFLLDTISEMAPGPVVLAMAGVDG